jgi:hypothetical protein
MVPFVWLGAPLSAAIVVSRAPEASDCPDTGQLAARIERLVGHSLAIEGATRAIVVRADFTRQGGAYEATLQMSGVREGERVLRDTGASCDALADAVAVTTALLLDASTREPEAAERAASQVPPSWLERWRLSGRFGAGTGLSGGPTFVAGAGLEVSLDKMTSIALGATWVGSHAHALGAGAVEVRLWYIELGGFRSLTGETFRFGPTAQVMGGALSGAGEGYPLSSSASLAWFAAGAGLRGELAAGPNLRLAARALAVMPARKQSFSIGYVGTAYEATPLAGVAEFVVSVKFW